MKLEVLWLVCDPTPFSGMADVCWEQPVRTLHYQIVGIHMADRSDWQVRHYTVWTTEDEAVADAKARLAARDIVAAGRSETPPEGAEDRCSAALKGKP
jgi:hypothetical protein